MARTLLKIDRRKLVVLQKQEHRIRVLTQSVVSLRGACRCVMANIVYHRLAWGLLVLLCGRAGAELLDMTHTFDNTSLYWPNGQAPFKLTLLDKGWHAEGFWYQGDEIRSGTHVGTHMDAPCHFCKDKWSIDEIPLDRLVARTAVVIDIRQRAAQSPDVNISLADVERFEETYGEIARGAVVVQCSGWSEKYPDEEAVFGNGRRDPADFHFPAFSVEAVRFLIEKRDIVGLAVDSPSVDPGQNDGDFPVHVTAGLHNVYLLENVKDTCLLPPVGATITSLPSRLKGASGAPARVFASWHDLSANGGIRIICCSLSYLTTFLTALSVSSLVNIHY